MNPARDKAAVEAAHAQANLAAQRFDVYSITAAASADFRFRLWSIEAELADLPFEVAFLYTADGQECERFKGTAMNVNVELSDEKQEAMAGGILTHNHPDGSFLSVKDIRLAYELNLAELRAVRKGAPARVLVAYPSAKEWSTLAEFDAYWDRELTLHYQRVYNHNRANGMPLKSEQAVEDKANETWSAYFQVKLLEIGYSYEEVALTRPGA